MENNENLVRSFAHIFFVWLLFVFVLIARFHSHFLCVAVCVFLLAIMIVGGDGLVFLCSFSFVLCSIES